MLLLCEEKDLTRIVFLICESLGISNEAGSNVLTLHADGVQARFQCAAKDYNENAAKTVEDLTRGILGYFLKVPAENQQDNDRKINVLQQLKRTAGICMIDYTIEGSGAERKQAELIGKLTGILDRLRGLLLVNEDGRDRLLNGAGRLVLNDKGKSQLDRYMPYVDQALVDMPKEGISQEQIRRRGRTRQFLEEKGIFVPEWYSYIESLSEARIRTPEEMADRTAALLAVSLYSEAMLGEHIPPAEARTFAREHALDRFGGDRVLSPKEKSYFYNDNAEEKEKISYSWQYENLFVMDWALGLIEELPFPNAICDVPLSVRVLKSFRNREELLAAARPRSGEELLDACDLIFCLDWACVDARVYKLPAPAGMDGGITMERHKTLNWLVGSYDNADWDDVRTDT